MPLFFNIDQEESWVASATGCRNCCLFCWILSQPVDGWRWRLTTTDGDCRVDDWNKSTLITLQRLPYLWQGMSVARKGYGRGCGDNSNLAATVVWKHSISHLTTMREVTPPMTRARRRLWYVNMQSADLRPYEKTHLRSQPVDYNHTLSMHHSLSPRIPPLW